MPQLIASVQGIEIKHVYIHKDRTMLGRNPDNDIVLDNMVVSGRHCAFELEGLADVYLEDLHSTNGTYVNDHMVKGRTLLHDGDIISIAHFRIRYLQASEEPSGFGSTMTMGIHQPQPNASFQVVSGSSAGLEVPVVKAVTTFGKPGVCVVSVSHRRTGFFVAHLAGDTVPLLNGKPVGEEALQLAEEDVLEIAGTRMLFHLKE
ncbi:MAG TPA: FHA domain-containing protein [Ramlibacter sp.]|uniref:FHA domain-containing protein n=1 Tax=Ramlibacter sp. TaxID=1917967 RepID=UPI002D11FDB5|nr:FHA domain-containing protein [Ramlibacter sp.]HVZ43133.1 FHA domain-containing protein [Ramlibacter sp.]